MTVGGYCTDVLSLLSDWVDLITFNYITGSSCCFIVAY
jgi:hypothetical protein